MEIKIYDEEGVKIRKVATIILTHKSLHLYFDEGQIEITGKDLNNQTITDLLQEACRKRENYK